MGPAIVAAAALLAALLSLLLASAWFTPTVPPPAAVPRVTVQPAPSPSPSPPRPSPTPSPAPAARPSPTAPPPAPVATPSPVRPRPPRTVLTPTPPEPEPVEVPTAPSPEFVEVPLDAPSPSPSPAEEAAPEGPLAVDARIDRWPADGPDPAVRVRLVVANPSSSEVLVETAEVVFQNATGNLGADRQDLGSVAGGASEEVWFYYGNAARFWDVRAWLRLVYRSGGATFVVEREVR